MTDDEREQLAEAVNGRVRAERKLEEAHQAIDLLLPPPPRRLREPGPLLTPAGRVEWYREHIHDAWERR